MFRPARLNILTVVPHANDEAYIATAIYLERLSKQYSWPLTVLVLV